MADSDESYDEYLIRRLRNASILDHDIYQLLHAAAHRIQSTLPKEQTP